MSGVSPLFVCEKSKADLIYTSSLYYQHDPERLPACPLTIHALLHIPDQIRWMGPCWTTWAFPIERQCGYFQYSIQSSVAATRLIADPQAASRSIFRLSWPSRSWEK